MKILVASKTSGIADYLKRQNLEVEELFTNDLAVQMIEEHKIDVVVYMANIDCVVSHEKCLADIKNTDARVILFSQEYELMNYAAMLGIADIIIPPLSFEDILDRLHNPKTQKEIAEMLVQYRQKMPVDESTDTGKKPEIKQIKEQAEETKEKEVTENDKSECHIINRQRKGKIAVIVCVGDRRIEEWICNTYSSQLDILLVTSDVEEAKQKTVELHPDILILMEHNQSGGVLNAEEAAIWAIDNVPASLYILGALTEKGLEIESRVKQAGVRHVLTCEPGGHITGEELLYVIEGVISDIKKAEIEEDIAEMENGFGRSKISIGKFGKEVLGKSLFAISESDKEKLGEKKERAKKQKKAKPKINLREGISLEDDDVEETFVASVVKNPTSLVPGGILAVVSPWKPSLAGRLAAQIARISSEVEDSVVAYIGASRDSTGSIWLDVSMDELMLSDWRIPGSRFPVVKENIVIYATDPAKNLAAASGDVELIDIIKAARKQATYTVIDFAGDMGAVSILNRIGNVVYLVVLPSVDPVEKETSLLWLRNFMEGKENVVVGLDSCGINGQSSVECKIKFVIRNNPADAIANSFQLVGKDELAWK